jgi:hypothetical protein
MFGFGKRFTLPTNFFLRQDTELIDGIAHILADGFQVLLCEEGLDTGQNL